VLLTLAVLVGVTVVAVAGAVLLLTACLLVQEVLVASASQ
jgi:hypothetical protein